jgi:hypothetical protein
LKPAQIVQPTLHQIHQYAQSGGAGYQGVSTPGVFPVPDLYGPESFGATDWGNAQRGATAGGDPQAGAIPGATCTLSNTRSKFGGYSARFYSPATSCANSPPCERWVEFYEPFGSSLGAVYVSLYVWFEQLPSNHLKFNRIWYGPNSGWCGGLFYHGPPINAVTWRWDTGLGGAVETGMPVSTGAWLQYEYAFFMNTYSVERVYFRYNGVDWWDGHPGTPVWNSWGARTGSWVPDGSTYYMQPAARHYTGWAMDGIQHCLTYNGAHQPCTLHLDGLAASTLGWVGTQGPP